MDNEKSLTIAYILLAFTGFFGGHRFYLEKIGTGLLYLFTGGFFFFGIIYDLITLPKQVREINDRLYGQRMKRHYMPPAQPHYSRPAPPSPPFTPPEPRKQPESAEKQIFKLAQEKKGRLTVSEVVANTSLSLDKAETTLKELASKGYIGMRVTDSGLIIYEFDEMMGQSAN